MVSRQYRSNKTIGNKVRHIESLVDTASRKSVDAQAPDTTPITDDRVTNGTIGTQQLGIVNQVNSDSVLEINAPTAIDLNSPELNFNGDGLIFPGDLKLTSAVVFPGGSWMVCNGASLLIATYPTLYVALGSGTKYGAPDGTHFYLPNLLGMTVVQQDAGQTEFAVIGQTGGTKTHTHPLSSSGQAQITDNTPNGVDGVHMNRVTSATYSTSHQFVATGGLVGAATRTVSTGAALAGATNAGSTIQPYITLNYLVYAPQG